MRRTVVLIVLVVCTVATFAWWWRQGVAVPLVDAPEHLQCVSYAPYRRPEQSPFQQGIVVPPAQIEADLAVLARQVDCVRTYSVDQGLDQVPRLARKYGLRVLLGVWLGRDPAQNEREMKHAIEVATREKDAIEAIVVGNEVLLRRELPASTLARHIARVRDATGMPVTYADVWEFWLRNPQVAESTSFVTIHILPYWEDEPVPIENAVDHVVAIHRKVSEAMPGKRLLIGETGWPSAGRNRHGAQPGRVEQARFVREVAVAAAKAGLHYNVVEAFDQPWKRQLEGTVGGYWGIYDSHLRAKFPFRGPVEPDPGWRRGLVAMGGGALLLVAAGLLRRARWRGLLGLALAGATAAGALAAQVRYLLESNRGFVEWTVSGVYTMLAVIAAWVIARALARWLDGGAAPESPAPFHAAIGWFRTNKSRHAREALAFGALRFLFFFGMAVVCLLLVFDPRYRDFPLALYAVPFIGLWLLRLAGAGTVVAIEERLLAVVAALSAPAILVHEGLHNPHAVFWALLTLAAAALAMSPRVREEAAEQAHR